MISGFNQAEEEIIKGILSEYPYEFFCYGSRVKGDFTVSSDLDILLKSDKPVDYVVIAVIEQKFNESKLPYRVNITDYNVIDKYFFDLIKKDLVKIK